MEKRQGLYHYSRNLLWLHTRFLSTDFVLELLTSEGTRDTVW